MTDRRLYADDQPLDHPRGLYAVHGDGTTLWGLAARRVGTSEAARRHGVLEMGDVKADVGKAILVMLIRDWHPDTMQSAGFGQMLRNAADVKRLVGRMARPVTFGLTPDYRNDPGFHLVARGRVRAATDPKEISPRRWVMSFAVDLIDAFWRDAEPVEVNELSSVALRGGAEPIPDPLILVPGQGPGMRVRIRDSITGQWIAYDGDVPVGQYVRLEPHTETAYIVPNAHAWTGGTEDAVGVTVGPSGFELQPEIEWTSTVPGTRIRAARAY